MEKEEEEEEGRTKAAGGGRITRRPAFVEENVRGSRLHRGRSGMIHEKWELNMIQSIRRSDAPNLMELGDG